MNQRHFQKLYVFRHGETDWNIQQRIQGQLDIPLNGTGRAQAEALRPVMKRIGVEAILSSDLSRARETAQIVASEIGIPLFLDQGLREIHFGHAQGLSRADIGSKFGEDVAKRIRDTPLTDAETAFIGSETREEVTKRALNALIRFSSEHDFTHVGISTHGGIIRYLIQHILGSGVFPPKIPNGTVFPFILNLESGKLSIDTIISIS